MADTTLIGLFLTKRDVYDKYESTVPRHLLEPESQTIIEDIGEWYKTNPQAGPIVPKDITQFWEFVKLVRHSGMAASKLDALKALLQKGIKDSNAANASQILRALVLRDHAGRIAEKADRFSSGDLSINLYDELLDDVETAQKDAGIYNTHSQEVEFNLKGIINNLTNLTTGLQFRSPALQAALGLIRKGDFLMFAGFVDSGKSTLLASEASYMATQLKPGRKVLYFNNEEQGQKVLARVIQATVGWTLDQIAADMDTAYKLYSDAMGGDVNKVIVVDSERAPITPGLIRKKLREYDAGLMVFDQMYKIRGFKRYGDDKLGQLQDIFEYGRQLAKQYCPVIAVHQARGDANGMQKVEMHQLAGSQQALQGELDAIVTIGRDLNFPHMRYLYVPKNKLPTPGDPAMRNGFFEVQPQFDIGRFQL